MDRIRILIALGLGWFSAAFAGSGSIELTLVTAGTGTPVALRSPLDDSGRRFIVDLNGRISVLDAADNLLTTPFLDLGPNGLNRTRAGGERGLLGLAFHPDFASNGRFFVNYTNNPGSSTFATIVEEFQVSADPNVADASSGSEIIRVGQDFSNHNGGDIQFGPDGYLYIGMGDGGSGNDPCNRAQDGQPLISPAPDPSGNTGPCSADQADPTRALLGKLLRIDVDNPGINGAGACGAATSYGIPPDNPFTGTTMCSEIYASGLRNPYRFSFDRLSGDILIGDVGQGIVEEINRAEGVDAGLNYGWDCREGDLAGQRPSPECATAGELVDPIIAYRQSGGRCSVIGGYVYGGGATSLRGQYFYGDYCTGEIFADSLAVFSTTPSVVAGPGGDYCSSGARCLLGFGEDAIGNLYVLDVSGEVFLIEESDVRFASGFE